MLTQGLFCFSLPFRDRGREREKHHCERSNNWSLPGCAQTRVQLLEGETNPQPRHVPWRRIKPATLWLQDNAPSNWATDQGSNFKDSRAKRSKNSRTGYTLTTTQAKKLLCAEPCMALSFLPIPMLFFPTYFLWEGFVPGKKVCYVLHWFDSSKLTRIWIFISKSHRQKQ